MALSIRSFAALLAGALLAIAATPALARSHHVSHHRTHHHSLHSHAQAHARSPIWRYSTRSFAPTADGTIYRSRLDGPDGGPVWHGPTTIRRAPFASAPRGPAYAGNPQPDLRRPTYAAPGYAPQPPPPPPPPPPAQIEAPRTYAAPPPSYGDAGQRGNGDWRNGHDGVFHGPAYIPPMPGYGYARLNIGARIEGAFMHAQYWIQDPGVYHLPPAHGPYRWVRYYNDCLLIDIDTGQIADARYSVFG